MLAQGRRWMAVRARALQLAVGAAESHCSRSHDDGPRACLGRRVLLRALQSPFVALRDSRGRSVASSRRWRRIPFGEAMKTASRLLRGLSAGLSAGLLAATALPAARAQEPSDKTLSIVVVIDNWAGAGGDIAPYATMVAYDPMRDLAPLTKGMNLPNVRVVPPGPGVKTLPEIIALAKREPGKLNYGSTGAGSASHRAGGLFGDRAGIDIVHVPYKGGARAMTELLAGRISIYFATLSTAGPHIAVGRLLALATTGVLPAPGTRAALVRDIETESRVWAEVVVDREITSQ
ncbi:MAG: hypothetical protein C0505_08965 [Leptothrix sp. (in: Bacteria)]|nr:hypothetical protein [Leptothrix sp. (in: b-proteobacteria)]